MLRFCIGLVVVLGLMGTASAQTRAVNSDLNYDGDIDFQLNFNLGGDVAADLSQVGGLAGAALDYQSGYGAVSDFTQHLGVYSEAFQSLDGTTFGADTAYDNQVSYGSLAEGIGSVNAVGEASPGITFNFDGAIDSAGITNYAIDANGIGNASVNE